MSIKTSPIPAPTCTKKPKASSYLSHSVVDLDAWLKVDQEPVSDLSHDLHVSVLAESERQGLVVSFLADDEDNHALLLWRPRCRLLQQPARLQE